MSQRSVNFTSFTPTPTADAATAYAANTYVGIQGASAIGTTGYRVGIQEIFCGGQAPTTSSPMYMVFARDSTVAAATPSLGTNAHDACTTAESPTGTALGFTTTSGAQPQRSTTLQLINLSFNAFGGICKWQSPQIPGKEISLVGAANTTGELSLSQFTGGTSALIGAHILYEAI